MWENFFFAIFVILVAVITLIIGWLLWQLGIREESSNKKKSGKKR